MPNRFWPNTTSPNSTGNLIQQNTAANNPDVFCESQGSGYRVPSAGEYQSGARTTNPWGSSQPVTPRHWSAYVDPYNELGGVLPNVTGRTVSGSVINEWGNLANYSPEGSGWKSIYYWTAEPSRVNTKGTGAYGENMQAGRARYNVNVSTGAVTAYTANVYKGAAQSGGDSPDFANTLSGISCVRDLVPTPSTPNPGKS